jgi:hypothetical protein
VGTAVKVAVSVGLRDGVGVGVLVVVGIDGCVAVPLGRFVKVGL